MMTAENNTTEAEFTLAEAFNLINKTVVEQETLNIQGREISSVGVVVGLLTMNEEIEVVLKFARGLVQLTKAEFADQIEAVSHD